MTAEALGAGPDSPRLRKARGAFFTPQPISRFITEWAVRDSCDRVLEPSTGDAAFLVEAVARLAELSSETSVPHVSGVEIHSESAQVAKARVEAAGGVADIRVSDFFTVKPTAQFDVVIGNPPYIRYQDFTGESRVRSREAALKAGVALTALASSWAAFTVHSALFLRPGGRMGLVLPAELLSVNYAAAVRSFLLERFRRVELVLFEQQVFPEAEADVLLLLAEGFEEGPTDRAVIYQAHNADSLANLDAPSDWKPLDPAGKWTGLLVSPDAVEPLHSLMEAGQFTHLESWGDTTLGMVTGNNSFFALSPQRVEKLGLQRSDLLRLSPPGSSHLRGLRLSHALLARLGQQDRATWLFRPGDDMSDAAAAYVEAGEVAGVDQAYKCRVRKPWYRVPLVASADLLLTCMNADTPRLTTNDAGVRHLNSVHGVYLADKYRTLGRDLLPIATLNSVTMLNAEMVGRSYGGGILKLEPREADVWAVPAPELLAARAHELRSLKVPVARLLQARNLTAAVQLVDEVLLRAGDLISKSDLEQVRSGLRAQSGRRKVRANSGR